MISRHIDLGFLGFFNHSTIGSKPKVKLNISPKERQLYIGLNVGTPHTRLTIVVDTILVTVALEALVVIVASSAVQQRWS